jgi:hypothetical protein
MPTVSGVEFQDIASGKVARVFAGAFDILNEGPNEGSQRKRPARAIAVAQGPVTITGIDGVDVDLPDMGGAWQWDIQAIAIVSGDGVVIW